MMPKATTTYTPPLSDQETDQMDVLTFNSRIVDPLLFRLLSVRTPSGKEAFVSTIVTKAIKDFCPNSKKPRIDTEGNIIFEIGERGKDHNTMFSCHLDTVHTSDGPLTLLMTNSKYKTYGYGYIFGATRSKEGKLSPEILGADDRAGMWIMLKMIQKKIPGLYVFHTWEERGAKGSEHICKNTPDLVKDIKRCIAFDRRGYSDVIGSQRGSKCCSDDFGKALAGILNTNMPPKQQFSHGAVGSFTDSASYTSIIPECTNISVGYFEQHSTREHLDYVFLSRILLPAVLAADWESLPTVRDPSKVEHRTYHHHNSSTIHYADLKVPLKLEELYDKDGKLLPHMDLMRKIETWLKNWHNTDTYKAFHITEIIKALDAKVVSVTPEEVGPEVKNEGQTVIPFTVQHGTLMTKQSAQIDRLLHGLKECIEIYQDMENFATVPEDVSVVYANVCEPSINSIRILSQMYNEKKVPAENVLRASVEAILGFIILFGKIHNKTKEHANLIEDQLELLAGFIQEDWIGKTNIPKYAGIPESEVVCNEAGMVVHINSPCQKKCNMNDIGGCLGCGRTKAEKKEYDNVTPSEQEEIWVMSKLRKIAFKDLETPLPVTTQVVEKKTPVEEVPAGVSVH